MSPEIARNLDVVKRRIAQAARRAGRDPDEVALVGVTKKRPVEQVQALIAAGQRVLAENRVQEALARIETFADAPGGAIEWHLIGHLQTNKAGKVAGRFALIHSVDSLRVAEALERAAERDDSTVDFLLQMNVSGEESKFGLSPDALPGTIEELRAFERVRCRGFMTMAPFVSEPEEARPVFRALRALRDRVRDEAHEHIDMRHLSMGMTNDFEVAVEEGATLVRVGTALFQ